PETKGQLVFKDFFQRPTATEWMETPDEALRRLDDERLERKRHRRELFAALAVALRVSVEDIPTDPRKFQQFIQARVYRGFSKRDMKRRNITVRVDRKIADLLKNIERASDAVAEVQRQIADVKGSVAGG